MQNPMRPPADADTTWWVRWAARGLGVVGGVCTFISAIYIISCCFSVSMAFGIWVMISFDASCLAAGLIQMFVCLRIIIFHFNYRVVGFFVVALEAPFCCMWLDFIERIAEFSENRPLWLKAVIYAVYVAECSSKIL